VPTVIDGGSTWLDRIWVVHVDDDSDMFVDSVDQVEEQDWNREYEWIREACVVAYILSDNNLHNQVMLAAEIAGSTA